MSGRDLPDQELAQSLVGRTITRVRWFDQAPDEDWSGHELAWVWLDDGRVIEFGGYGYDAWGATLDEIEVVDVAFCDHCGKEHRDARVSAPWEWSSDHLPRDSRFAWCDDGNHSARLVP